MHLNYLENIINAIKTVWSVNAVDWLWGNTDRSAGSYCMYIATTSLWHIQHNFNFIGCNDKWYSNILQRKVSKVLMSAKKK